MILSRASFFPFSWYCFSIIFFETTLPYQQDVFKLEITLCHTRHTLFCNQPILMNQSNNKHCLKGSFQAQWGNQTSVMHSILTACVHECYAVEDKENERQRWTSTSDPTVTSVSPQSVSSLFCTHTVLITQTQHYTGNLWNFIILKNTSLSFILFLTLKYNYCNHYPSSR